jgi:type IV pilus assembly protein PilN
MRFEINLASQPYQDVQKFLTRWGIAVGVLAVITILLTYRATSDVLSWRITRKQVNTLEQQIAERERKKSDVEAFLNRPENSETRDRSRFLNSLIARKAFSWTEVFTDLERIVPAHLKVVAIRPKVNDEDQLMVHLRVASPEREPAIELVSRIEQSPHFSHAAIISEVLGKEAGAHNQDIEIWNFDIIAMYIPAFARPAGSAAKLAAAPEETDSASDPEKATDSAAAAPAAAKKLKPGPVKVASIKEAQHAGH